MRKEFVIRFRASSVERAVLDTIVAAEKCKESEAMRRILRAEAGRRGIVLVGQEKGKAA